MSDVLMPRARRSTRRQLRAVLRDRARQNRLVNGCKKKARSLASHLLATGADKDTATGAASGLRSVAKRMGIEPAEMGRTRRTVKGGRGRLHKVARYTRQQVLALAKAYKPRKAEYKMAREAVLTRSA